MQSRILKMRKVLFWVIGFPAVIVLAVLSVSWIAGVRLDRKVDREMTELLAGAAIKNDIVLQSDLEKLPACVRKWLDGSGIVGKERISTVRLRQKGMMRPDPSGPWKPFHAEQVLTVDKPSFVWKAGMPFLPLVGMTARDKYEDGRGNMLVKLMSFIPVADARGKEIDQGAMLRFLAETVWFPSAALCDYIAWEEVDSTSARATMTYGGVTASGVYRFGPNGDVLGFEAKRYGDFGGRFSLEDWLITMKDSKSFAGIRIPYSSELTWKLKAGDYTWLKLEITELEYNARTPY
jgi:hypothetical protein